MSSSTLQNTVGRHVRASRGRGRWPVPILCAVPAKGPLHTPSQKETQEVDV